MKVLAGLLLFALSSIGPAAAGDCWLPSVDNAVDAREGRLQEALRAAEAAQRADAALNAIANVRYQLHRTLSMPAHPQAPASAESYVMLHKPEAWAGTCGLQPWADDVHFASLTVHLNSLRPLVDPAAGGYDADTEFFLAPEVTAQQGGYPVYERRVLVITPDGVPPFVPVSVGEHLDAWQRRLQDERTQARGDAAALADDPEWRAYIQNLERSDPQTAAELRASLDEAARLAQDGHPVLQTEWDELQRQRAALDADARRQPVYLSAASMAQYRFGYAAASEDGARPLVKVNPALWAGAGGTQDIRVVALEVLLNASDTFAREDDADQAAARAWLSQVDVRPYRALLTDRAN